MPCYNVDMAGLSISLLGRFAVQLGDRPLITFRTKSVAALLIILASETRETNLLRREWLTELLWPDQPAGAGRKNLRQSLYELRQAIPEVISRESPPSPHPFVLADRQTIYLNSACDYQVDTADFESLLANGEIDTLRQAIEVYQGDFLADFYLPESSAFEDWAAAKRALYHRLALDTMDRLAQHDLQHGQNDRAASLARRQLELDNLRETAVQQLMVALAMSGRRNEALAQYEESRAELAKELGVEPEPATKRVYDRIASGEIQRTGGEILALLQPEAEAALAPTETVQTSQGAANNNLPAEPTPFVGREQELLGLTSQLLEPSCRLLTILGPGGSGKSRLAVQSARRLLEDQPDSFPDGIWYASLTEPSDAVDLASVLVDNLPFTAFDLESDLRTQLLAYLERRRMLLLLDNMEYSLAPGGTMFLSEMLERAPDVTLLAGSRTRLNLHAEQLFPLAGLDVPQESDIPEEEAADYSALQLFANSAKRVRPDFALNASTIPPVLAICRLLQGIPLAIELAASWVEVMSANEVATEVNRCLDFLETDLVDVPERQRSLRAVYEASWRLLNGQERSAFLRLSVFQGGFDYEAARRVADANHRTLLGLLNKSWLHRDEKGRYLAHEMLRQYAYQRLYDDERAWESAHERHSAYFAGLIREQGEMLKGLGQFAATDRIDRDLDNVSAAWDWLVEREQFETLIDTMLPGLFLYFAASTRGQRLVTLVDRAYHQLLAGRAGDRPDWQVILLTAKAAFPTDFLITRNFVVEAASPTGGELVETAYEIARENDLEDQLGIWSIVLAMLYGWTHDQAAAIEWLHRLVESYRAQDDKWLLAFALENLGGLMMPSGRGRPGGHEGTVDADRYLDEASALFETLGDRREKGYSMRLWGLVRRGWDFDGAKRILLTAKNDMLAAGDQLVEMEINIALADVCMARAEVSESFDYLQQACRGYHEMGSRLFEAGALGWEALWALRLDTVDHARKARQESLDIAQTIGDNVNLAWGRLELGDIERVAGNYTVARSLFEEARTLFEALVDPFGQAFYERALGDLAYALDDFQEAKKHFEESLRLARKYSHQWLVVHTLFGLARTELALAQGNADELAQEHILEGLRSADYHRYWDQFAIGVTGLAASYVAGGQLEEAMSLLQTVLAWPLTWQETRAQARELRARILIAQPLLANATDESPEEDMRAFLTKLLAKFDP